MSDSKQDIKKNTDVWKQKQEEKKKKKEAQQQEGQKQTKKDKKEKKNNEAEKKPESKPQEVKLTQIQKKQIQKQPTALIQKTYRKLQTVDSLLFKKNPPLNRENQKLLIFKYMEQLTNKQDRIIFFSKNSWSPVTGCEQVNIPEFTNAPHAEIVCRYCDLSYLMENAITKIFIEGIVVFQDGSILAEKGTLNVILMANAYKIPVIGCCGSWKFNAASPFSQVDIDSKYGPQILKKHDWIQANMLTTLVLQIGAINPRHVSTYPAMIYKDLANAKW